jgi:cysteine desulfurase / selenocysteine lyase
MVKLMAKTQNELDITRIREDFPVLHQDINGYPLVYLDNAATTQKPQQVIRRITDFYSNEYATVRRGVYTLSAQSTIAFEQVRLKVAEFIHAPSASEIVFTRGTTEAINLVANGFGRKFIQEGDEIIISAIEHHANIVPWQQIALEQGATLKVIPVDSHGDLILEEYEKLLSDKTKIVAVNYISNALGTINPVKDIINLAHRRGIPVLIDGAQSAPHMPVDVQELDCDFYAFSSHKLYGPSGVGVLYGKMQYLEAMNPYQYGGDMIEFVTFAKTTFAKPPHKFEAGTPAIAEVIGLGAAIDYLNSVGLETIQAHENKLLAYATQALQQIDGLKIIGTAKRKAGIVSFVFDDIHPHDVGTILDQRGVAVRAGHHCAQPIMDRYDIVATTRASFGVYNTIDEVDRLVEGLQDVIKVFR